MSTELLPEGEEGDEQASGISSGSSGSSSSSSKQGYILQETGRYAHSPSYIGRVAAETGWRVVALEGSVIRTNAGKPIHGNLCVLQRL
jgi:predicted TPR repeat methyltransferase